MSDLENSLKDLKRAIRKVTNRSLPKSAKKKNKNCTWSIAYFSFWKILLVIDDFCSMWSSMAYHWKQLLHPESGWFLFVCAVSIRRHFVSSWLGWIVWLSLVKSWLLNLAEQPRGFQLDIDVYLLDFFKSSTLNVLVQHLALFHYVILHKLSCREGVENWLIDTVVVQLILWFWCLASWQYWRLLLRLLKLACFPLKLLEATVLVSILQLCVICFPPWLVFNRWHFEVWRECLQNLVELSAQIRLRCLYLPTVTDRLVCLLNVYCHLFLWQLLQFASFDLCHGSVCRVEYSGFV